MLQQTRIEAATSYYLRFMHELPTVEALAAVSDDKLMKLWEGLGYYSRARNLKKAACLLVEQYGGMLPSDAEELRKIPGIGAYTAGAIASIAYGKPEPAVDGNVLRVVMRLTASDDDIAKETTKRAACEALRAVYPSGENAAALTQAVMELGEVVCLPNGAPKCDVCPLGGLCRARLCGETEKYPVRSPKKERRKEEKTVFLILHDGKFAVRKREERGLLAGMWEFPLTDGFSDDPETARLLEAWGVRPRRFRSCGNAVHIFTHIEWDMRGVFVLADRASEAFVWKSADDIEREIALPSAFRAFGRRLRALEKENGGNI